MCGPGPSCASISRMNRRTALLLLCLFSAAWAAARGPKKIKIPDTGWQLMSPSPGGKWRRERGYPASWKRTHERVVSIRRKRRRVTIEERLGASLAGARRSGGRVKPRCGVGKPVGRAKRGERYGRDTLSYKCPAFRYRGGADHPFTGVGVSLNYEVEVCRFGGGKRAEMAAISITQKWRYYPEDWARGEVPPVWKHMPIGRQSYQRMVNTLVPQDGRTRPVGNDCETKTAKDLVKEPLVTGKLKPIKPFGSGGGGRSGIMISRPDASARPSAPGPPERRRRPVDQGLLDRLLGRKSKKRVFRDITGRAHVREEGEKEPPLREHSQEFRTSLLKDDKVREGYDRWAYLDDEERRRILGRVASLHARAYDMPPASLTFGETAGANGFYRNGSITLSDELDLSDPDSVFGTVAHESTHHFQDGLIARLKDGRIGPGHELYQAALDFEASQSKYCCPTASCRNRCSYEEYRGQANERHAFEEGEGATQHLRRKLSRSTFDEYRDIVRGR